MTWLEGFKQVNFVETNPEKRSKLIQEGILEVKYRYINGDNIFDINRIDDLVILSLGIVKTSFLLVEDLMIDNENSEFKEKIIRISQYIIILYSVFVIFAIKIRIMVLKAGRIRDYGMKQE